MAEPTAIDTKDSVARVAWDMVKYLRGSIPGESTAQKVEGYLDLYARCYEAAAGRRTPKE